MIRSRNLATAICELLIPGTLSATGNVTTFPQAISVVPFDGWISNIYCPGAIGAQDGVDETSIDIAVNGTSIFATGSTMTLVGTTGAVGSYGTLENDPIAVEAGDVLSAAVTAIGGNPPSGVAILVTISKDNDAPITNLADQNQVK